MQRRTTFAHRDNVYRNSIGSHVCVIAELVVRELEKDAVQCATEKAVQDDVGAAPMTRYMMRSVACFQQQGVAFVDTQPHAWQALHCNIALSDVR